MNWFNNFCWKIVIYFGKWAKPYPDEIVLGLILNTASLGLTKQDYLDLAPIKGTCGPFRLTGNSLPVFTYNVFEKSIMEFIKIRVEISKPDRIEFFATIDSTTAPERHGEVIPVKSKYTEPFTILSHHLYRYFPYPRKG